MEAQEYPEIADVNHLPIVRKYINRLEIAQIVNEMVSSSMEIDIGETLVFLILDTLSGRSPLYRMAERHTNLDIEALMGTNFNPVALQAHNLGRAMDCLHEAGTQKLFCAISHRAIEAFRLDLEAVHFDTTSAVVYGSEYPEKENAPHVTYGYSKAHRPDLMQILVQSVCVEKNIPILGRVENGNASDVTLNNRILTDVSTYLAEHGVDEKATIYVADAALPSADNLEKANQMRFLTRLPARYTECGRVIEAAVDKDASDWTQIGTLSQKPGSAKRPAASYQYQEASVTLHGILYRTVVVHSSSHDRRRQKAVDTKIKADRQAIDALCKETLKIAFHCREDAEDAANRLIRNTSALHDVKAKVVAVPRYGKGRPSSETERTPLRTDYCVEVNVTENNAAIATLRQKAGCFVLLTNLSSAAEQKKYDGKTLLSLYKEQYGIEQNFGFIKDPAIVDSIFLKRPERIEVLGLILLLSLLVWRLMEREMRHYLDRTETQLSGWNQRKTTQVTSFMLTTKFRKIRLYRVNGNLVLAQKFTDTQNDWLKALGMGPDDFLPPKSLQKIIKPPPEGC